MSSDTKKKSGVPTRWPQPNDILFDEHGVPEEEHSGNHGVKRLLGEIHSADNAARKSLIREVVKYVQAGGHRFFQKDATGKYQEITKDAATQITRASCLRTKDAKEEPLHTTQDTTEEKATSFPTSTTTNAKKRKIPLLHTHGPKRKRRGESSAKSHEKSRTGPIVDEPSAVDILNGRGTASRRHAGNVAFRSIVMLHVTSYIKLPRAKRRLIAESIVRSHGEIGGRFLERNQDDLKWYLVDWERCVVKTQQALREGHARLRDESRGIVNSRWGKWGTTGPRQEEPTPMEAVAKVNMTNFVEKWLHQISQDDTSDDEENPNQNTDCPRVVEDRPDATPRDGTSWKEVNTKENIQEKTPSLQPDDEQAAKSVCLSNNSPWESPSESPLDTENLPPSNKPCENTTNVWPEGNPLAREHPEVEEALGEPAERNPVSNPVNGPCITQDRHMMKNTSESSRLAACQRTSDSPGRDSAYGCLSESYQKFLDHDQQSSCHPGQLQRVPTSLSEGVKRASQTLEENSQGQDARNHEPHVEEVAMEADLLTNEDVPFRSQGEALHSGTRLLSNGCMMSTREEESRASTSEEVEKEEEEEMDAARSEAHVRLSAHETKSTNVTTILNVAQTNARKEENNTLNRLLGGLSTTSSNLEIAAALEEIFGFVDENDQAGCSQLLEADGVKIILNRMELFHFVDDVQVAGCAVLWRFAENAPLRHEIYNKNGMQIVATAMQSFQENRELQAHGCGVFLRLLSLGGSRRGLVLAGVVDAVVHALRRHRDCGDICTRALSVLHYLSCWSSNRFRRAMTRSGGVRVVVETIAMLMKNNNNNSSSNRQSAPTTTVTGLALLCNLCRDRQNRKEIVSSGGGRLLCIQAVRQQDADEELRVWARRLLDWTGCS